MMRILFVDDEAQVLAGLRDLLRKQRKEWDMEFVGGGQLALAALEQRTFDVVVSDMRMPGVDGATVLQHVKKHQPMAARIILSGQADRDAVLRALPAAHQFLSKPCDAETLRRVIERACKLNQLLFDANIRAITSGLDHLPSAPHTYWELTQAAARPEAGVSDFAAIIEQDPAMSLKVLQLVNSAYFGLPKKTTSAAQAVVRLGVELLKALALSVHAFSALKVPSIRGFSIEELQQHSLQTARIGKLMLAHSKNAGDVFSAAMVHDVGKLVLAVGAPDRFAAVVAEQISSQRPMFEVEHELLGTSHAEVGAYLLASWGLPLQLVEAVAFHHTPGSVVDPDSLEVLAAVHVADVLSDARSYRSADPQRDGKLDRAFITSAALDAKLVEWRALVGSLPV
ncbi:MAG: hypothetical protein RL701_5091 [Pseudomonadota bacterium]